MGNRAYIVPKGMENIGVYLHWNGGIDSVTAFLRYCDLKEHRYFGGERADGYGIARLCQVIGNYIGGNLSLGIHILNEKIKDIAEHIDNGVYIVDGWKIVEHIGGWQTHEGYDITEMMIEIDEAQPPEEQLGKDFITAEEVDPTDLNIGDKVYIYKTEGKYELHTVVGFDKYSDFLLHMPYTDQYSEGDKRNFITETVRRKK